MKKVKIAHLYYDLMNLYGEHGNIRALEHHLDKHGITVSVDYLSIEDKINFNNYDLFYIGSGNEESFKLVLDNILKYKKDIKKAIDNKKIFVATGNAIDLFGKNFHCLDDSVITTLDVLDYEAFETDFRIVGEQTYTCMLDDEIIGFQNRSSVLKYIKEPFLFEVKQGTGYVPNSMEEGIHKKNFYGTYLLGPILIRNPHLTEHIIKELCKEKDYEYEYYHDEFEERSYHEYKKNLLHEE